MELQKEIIFTCKFETVPLVWQFFYLQCSLSPASPTFQQDPADKTFIHTKQLKLDVLGLQFQS